MGFKLPKLTTDIDCGPIGYPGLVITCVLNPANPAYKDYEPPDNPKAWDTTYYNGLSYRFESITLPADYTESGESITMMLPDAKAIYDLEQSDGFDQTILPWAFRQLQDQGMARLQAEAKN